MEESSPARLASALFDYHCQFRIPTPPPPANLNPQETLVFLQLSSEGDPPKKPPAQTVCANYFCLLLLILKGQGVTVCTNCPEIVCANCAFIFGWVGFLGGSPLHKFLSRPQIWRVKLSHVSKNTAKQVNFRGFTPPILKNHLFCSVLCSADLGVEIPIL